MEHSSQISFGSRKTRFSFVTSLTVALLIAGTAVHAGDQTDTALGSGALGKVLTGTDNTGLGFDALFEDTTSSNNTAVGANALGANIANGNTAVGANCLFDNSSGQNNTANGFSALFSNLGGDGNAAFGFNALYSNTTGSNNVGIGHDALSNNTTGNNNIGIGDNAGFLLSTGTDNIDIGNAGVKGESGVIRIGTKGFQNRVVIAGISGTPVFVGSPVLVNANGKLGISVSSALYKRDIHDMGEASERLMKLRPVTFRYKEDFSGTVQYGLVAEEVAQVYPELVTYGDDGKAQSVAYQMLPAMLLNELQKQARENRWKDEQIAALQKQVESLQKETARIDGLTARLCALERRADRTRPERLTAAMR
jgi:hypothetical protein